jgi:2-oxoglutarate dehydrogenase E2 component (dihydrolipoamide succinyltransferase)
LPVEIKVPSLGESVTSATVARWMKQSGDAVTADEPLVELETDKVTVEVNAPASGVLSEVAASEGQEVEVGGLLGTVEEGAGASAAAKPAPQPAAKPTPQEAPKPAAKPASAPQSGPEAQAPRPPEPAPPPTPPREAASRPAANPPAGVNPPPRPLGPVSRPASPTPVSPMPAAAKLMEEQHLAPEQLAPGTGKDGRITKGDVIAFLNRPAPKPAPAAPQPAARAPDAREERVRMTRLRKTIAARLKEAQNTAAMLTTFNEVDMSAVMAVRREYRDAFEKKHKGVRLGFMSFFVRACCVALKEFPAVNAEIDGDDLVYRNFVNMGIAVGGPSGLVVPVVRDADRLGFAEIEQAVSDLGSRVRDGALKLEELTGGTFSITNGGVYGSLMSTPILNPPQAAILGMHKIQDRPVAVDGKIEIRPMMYLALSYDHRIVDGKEAVSFLVRVKEGVEDPQRLLLEV